MRHLLLSVLFLLLAACSDSESACPCQDVVPPDAATSDLLPADLPLDLAGPDKEDVSDRELTSDLELDLEVGREVGLDRFGDGLTGLTLMSGRLPYGLWIARGVLRGRPVCAQDAEAMLELHGTETAQRTVIFRVRSGGPAILNHHPPAGAVGEAYDHALEAADFDGEPAWSLLRGELPPGLSLSDDGHIAGTPAASGVYPFLISAAAGEEDAARAFAVRIGDPVLTGYAGEFRDAGIERLRPAGLMLSKTPDKVYQDYGDSAMWNGTFLFGMACRDLVEGSAQSRADLEVCLDTATALREVTGVTGLTARGFEVDEWQEGLEAPQLDPDKHPEDHQSTTPGYGGYRWRGDTSRDQVTGLVLGNAMAYEVTKDPALAEQAATNLVAMARHVWDNGMFIVDPDGEPTKYGHCSAHDLEGFPIPNGVNAALTGSWLLAGAHAAPPGEDADVLTAAVEQIFSEEPPADSVNPDEYDYNGIMEMSFYAYSGYEAQWYNMNLSHDSFFTLLRLLPDGPVRDRLRHNWYFILWQDKGDTPTKRRSQSEENPWFTYLYMGATGAYDPDAAYEALVQLVNFMPPPRLGVDIHNSDDPAYPHDPDHDEWAFDPLPVHERCSGTNFTWQRCPYQLDCGGRAGTEWAGTDFLAPYWLGVLYGYVNPEL